jgi:hypothetical protein
MQTIFDSAAPVKSDRPFGVLPGRGRCIPSQADLDWAAQFYGELEDARLHDEENRELERRAGEAEWLDRFNASIAAGRCVDCGAPSDQLDRVHGLCPECLDRAEYATLASVNERAGLGYRVF